MGSVILKVHQDLAFSRKSAQKTPQDTSEKDHGRIILVAWRSNWFSELTTRDTWSIRIWRQQHIGSGCRELVLTEFFALIINLNEMSGETDAGGGTTMKYTKGTHDIVITKGRGGNWSRKQARRKNEENGCTSGQLPYTEIWNNELACRIWDTQNWTCGCVQ